jgi:hypothetical protein
VKIAIIKKEGKLKMKIHVIAKRWFQKSYGNTYHSVKVYVDGELIEYVPFEYGYGDQWQQTAHEVLMKHGYFPKTGKSLPSGMNADYYEFITWIRNNRENYSYTVQDVDRKKDL